MRRAATPRSLRRASACVALVLAAGCGGEQRGEPAAARETKAEPAAGLPEAEPARYIGSAACTACHAKERERWSGSDHALAMQAASAATLEGDFADATLDHFGTVSRFHRDGSRFLVRTDGADGALADHEVAYTLGVRPLQQLLVPGPGGRLQSLDLAWDARPKAAGGARWFHLQNEPIPPDDVLHWTRPSHTWNAMCADCHVTDYEKRYDAETDRYASRWSELGVGCEACHGPGSRHLAWAKAHPEARVESQGGTEPGGGAQAVGLEVALGAAHRFEFAPGAAIAHRVPAAGGAPVEIETCAPCHARRSTLRDGWRPGQAFLDFYRPALLDTDLYFADGQIDDEVYEYGSFLQSRMFAAGVVCSDCHDAHSLRVDADAVCSRCHRDEVFAVPAHHHHEPGSAGARCVACHMPTRTYMRIDERRDHSLRVPRPDLSVALGTPNACDACHAKKGAAWAAKAVSSWRRGAPLPPHYGSALDAGRHGLPGSSHALAALAGDAERPAIVRASALRLLPVRPDAETLAALDGAVRDADPLVRLAAAEAAEAWPAEPRRRLAAPLLRDPLRAVRVEAARVLASLPPAERNALGADFSRALAEYRTALARDADRPEARVSAGVLALDLGDVAGAQRAYEAALRAEPRFVPASVNLADLHRTAGRDAEGLQVLESALGRVPESAELHHALGLALVRAGRRDEAMAHLERAAKTAPEQARFSYVYAVALHDGGDAPRALAVLQQAIRRHPGDRDLRLALASFAAQAGQRDLAVRQLGELLSWWPQDPDAAALRAALSGAAAGPSTGTDSPSD